MKKEIRSDLTSKNKIADSINIVSKAVLAYEREPQKTEQQEDIKMKEVVVVSGVRLPVGSYGGSLKDITAIDMGAMVVKEAVKRAGIQPSDVDEVVIGQVGEVAENGFIARAVSLKAGMPKETTAYSVNRQCGSGLQSIAEAVMEIQTGQADVVVAGGTENISRLPYYVNDARWGARMNNVQMIDVAVNDGLLAWYEGPNGFVTKDGKPIFGQLDRVNPKCIKEQLHRFQISVPIGTENNKWGTFYVPKENITHFTYFDEQLGKDIPYNYSVFFHEPNILVSFRGNQVQMNVKELEDKYILAKENFATDQKLPIILEVPEIDVTLKQGNMGD